MTMPTATASDEYLRCIVIEGDGKTAPPPRGAMIPFNENSTRAMSKKIRVYVLRDFLFRNYSSTLTMAMGPTVLDVAGGKGDLSWILRNIDGVNSIVADPRTPNHRRLLKSVEFLLNHPEEAVIRAVEGLPTHQPLAKLLLPHLIDQKGRNDAEHSLCQTGFRNIGISSSPDYMRIHIDNTLVGILRRVLNNPSASELKSWDQHWETEKRKIESNKVHYGGTTPKPSSIAKVDGMERDYQISDSRLALNAFHSLDMIVGFHP
jgi:hypothetical protein